MIRTRIGTPTSRSIAASTRTLIGSAGYTAIAVITAAALLSACTSADGATRPAGAGESVTSATAAAPHASAHAAAKLKVAHRPTNHCAHNVAAQKVIVSIHLQHAWMCARHRTAYDTPVTSGMVSRSTRTPTGTYRIQGRSRNTVLTLSSGASFAVKYWIPFIAPLYGFHDSSWQHFPYGSPQYKTRGSHGCIHLPLKAMAFLYRWSARPTYVHIS